MKSHKLSHRRRRNSNEIFTGSFISHHDKQSPDHWFKKFLDSDADIFQQSYCLDDNPFLPESVRDALKKEYHGVFYERYILGQWAVAEGLVFPYFGEDTEKYIAREIPPPERVVIGIDFGGNGSMTSMTATGFYDGMRRLTALSEAALPVGAAIARARLRAPTRPSTPPAWSASGGWTMCSAILRRRR